MKFVTMKDASKLGIETMYVGGHETFCATYEGAVITKLFKHEEGAIEAAKAMIHSLSSSPILGVIGFDLDKVISMGDRICFTQVLRFGKEDYLVVGTEDGALEVIYESDRRDMYLDETDIEMGTRVYQAINQYAKLLERLRKKQMQEGA